MVTHWCLGTQQAKEGWKVISEFEVHLVYSMELYFRKKNGKTGNLRFMWDAEVVGLGPT